MNKPDDFDLIPRNRPGAPQGSTVQTDGQPPVEEPPEWPPEWPPHPEDDGPRRGRSWGLAVTIVGVALLAFGIGAALFTLRDRMNDAPTPTPGAILTPTRDANHALATLMAAATISATQASGTPTTTRAITLTTTPTVSPTPRVTPTPTPCALPVANGFQQAYRRETFGCATTGAQVVWTAVEPFERGAMLWRSDTNKSYVFTQAGQWQMITAGWDGQSTASRGAPPAGLYAPERGFGWVWGTSDPVFSALGWATDIEKGFCAEVQEYERGFYLQSMPVDSCTAENLYNQATAGDWRPILLAAHASGVWTGALGGSTAAALPVAEVTGRPEAQGVFEASRTDAIRIDGNLEEWASSGWIPIANVVEGHNEQDGARDAVGAFQVAWTSQGLVLAVQVRDDRFRPGPQGTDLWQGDSIEIQFDGRLMDDFADTSANDDDYQIGIAFLEDGRSLQMYRWLPFATEGSLAVIGAGYVNERGGDRGAALEVMIPWSELGIASPEAGRAYGFNVSISDNDGKHDAQETVLSASPARTTYNNPTQWGTLHLMP